MGGTGKGDWREFMRWSWENYGMEAKEGKQTVGQMLQTDQQKSSLQIAH